MAMRVHSTASIHPTAILEGELTIGEGTVVGPYCVLRGPLTLGSFNRLSAHVVIGEEPEHRAKGGEGAIHIGDHNVFREFTVIHRGTGERETSIGSHCYFMDKVHVSHDCRVEDNVTLAHNTVLAGHCKVMTGATTGISTVLHQWSVLGNYCMTGMGSVVTRDIPPFALVKGNPARFSRLNRHVFAKLNLAEADFDLTHEELRPATGNSAPYFESFQEFSKRKRLRLR